MPLSGQTLLPVATPRTTLHSPAPPAWLHPELGVEGVGPCPLEGPGAPGQGRVAAWSLGALGVPQLRTAGADREGGGAWEGEEAHVQGEGSPVRHLCGLTSSPRQDQGSWWTPAWVGRKVQALGGSHTHIGTYTCMCCHINMHVCA